MKEEESLLSTQTQSGQLLHYWGNTPEQEYYSLQGIKASKSFYTSPRGLKLFTRQWLPLLSPPRGLIFMVHGYGNDISWTFQATPIFLAQQGFACFALDLEGHGQSHGLRAFVPDVHLLVQDCLAFFTLVKQQETQFLNVPCFLYGESMGGAICLLIHFAEPEAFQDQTLFTFPETRATTDGRKIADVLVEQNIVPGIKVDEGLVPLAGSNNESWCQGLDGLASRSAAYYQQGARFAK
ncbi:caffeoylshikimate esterase [Prunus persica]|uniref:caffeoylshikimate esterase n=1 Tax=Prunus persica TaxID=3760 RepID=UPI0009AB6A3C|nr:caffeoylshikimate esterase [Prunus persica]